MITLKVFVAVRILRVFEILMGFGKFLRGFLRLRLFFFLNWTKP